MLQRGKVFLQPLLLSSTTVAGVTELSLWTPQGRDLGYYLPAKHLNKIPGTACALRAPMSVFVKKI